VAVWMESNQHTPSVTETKDDVCTDTEITSMEYLVGLRDFRS